MMKKILSIFLMLFLFASSVYAEFDAVAIADQITEGVKKGIFCPTKKRWFSRKPKLIRDNLDAKFSEDEINEITEILEENGIKVVEEEDGGYFCEPSDELRNEVQIEKVIFYIDTHIKSQIGKKIKKNPSKDFVKLPIDFFNFLKKHFDKNFLMEENIEKIQQGLEKIGYVFETVENKIYFFLSREEFAKQVEKYSELFEKIKKEVETKWEKIKKLHGTKKGKVMIYGGVALVVVSGVLCVIFPDETVIPIIGGIKGAALAIGSSLYKSCPCCNKAVDSV